jgi:hypothetical protein
LVESGGGARPSEACKPPSASLLPRSSAASMLGRHNTDLSGVAVVPANTPFTELVKVALGRLGFSSAEAIGAKGIKAHALSLNEYLCDFYDL